MILLTIFIIVLTGILFVLWYQTYSRFFRLLNKIPGPYGFPIIGTIWDSLGSSEHLFKRERENSKKFYPIFKDWSLNIGAVNLLQPDDIEIILSNSKHTDKSVIYNFLHSWLGTGLLTSGGNKWQTRRKILTPAFHFSILQEFMNIFNIESLKLVKDLRLKMDEPFIDVIPEITQYTLSSIAGTAMGIELDGQNDDYKKAIYVFGESVAYRFPRPWLFNETFFNLTKMGKLTRNAIKTLHDFSTKIVKEKRNNFSKSSYSSRKKRAMLDLLLSAQSEGAKITDDGIREEVDTFMFEGHDTTSLALCYTLLLLANNKKIQDDIYEEIKDTIGDEHPTFNDLKELPFLERCIKESLRLYPSVPTISRVVKEEVTTSTGYVIPKYAMTHIHIYDLHRNPLFFPDPEKFNPDRFLPENTKTRHPFCYIPFSAGPRNCIGQKFAMIELKVALCAILKNFILEPLDKIEDVTFITDLVLRSKGSIKIKFKLRC